MARFEFKTLASAHAEIARLRRGWQGAIASAKALSHDQASLGDPTVLCDAVEEIWALRRQLTHKQFLLESAEQKLAGVTEVLEGNAREVLVKSMHFEAGKFDAWLQHPFFGLFISALAHVWFESGAKNFLTISAFSPEPGPGFFDILIQKCTGETPAKQRDAARAEADRLAYALQVLLLTPRDAAAVALAQALLETREAARLNSQAPGGSLS